MTSGAGWRCGVQGLTVPDLPPSGAGNWLIPTALVMCSVQVGNRGLRAHADARAAAGSEPASRRSLTEWTVSAILPLEAERSGPPRSVMFDT